MPEASQATSLERDFALAEAAVREAGALAHAWFFAGANSWSKADTSPVSDADHAVDRLLHDRLTAHRPGYGWISEESPDDPARLDRERVWIVDPIDGTRAFLKHRPHWVVSAALAVAGRPQFGFLYNPVTAEFFAAMRGRGATLNGRPIAAGGTGSIAGCHMLTNPSRLAPERWSRPWPPMEVSRFNSFAYKVALVAAGRADATIAFARIHQWDLAAADVILSEAGGVMTEPDGSPLAYNTENLRFSGAVAANPALQAALVDFIAGNLHNEPHRGHGPAGANPALRNRECAP